MIGSLRAAERFRLREPDRSRRILRLLCANYLAHVQDRTSRRPGPAVWASLSLQVSANPASKATTLVPVYALDPRAPAAARVLEPRELARWLLTADDLKPRVFVANNTQRPWSPNRLRDRKAYRALVLTLAETLYRRERGVAPPSLDVLVGPYLKRLPDDGTGDVDGESVPKVER